MVWPELEKEFSNTTRILLGESLSGIDDYGSWLGKHIPLPHPAKSAVSDKIVWNFPTLNFMGRKISTKRSISMEEMGMVNQTKFTFDDIKSSDLKDMMTRIVTPIAYAIGNYRWRTYTNVDKCGGAGDGMFLYYGDDLYGGIKNVAYSNYTMYSQNMFGCHNTPYSQFCIHTYNSVKVTRAFEVDGCYHSSDILFCHNSEGLTDCMFCFNVKNKRYAIGNIEVGREQYMRVKKILLQTITSQLMKTRALDFDIYSIGKPGEKHD
ncbi:Uncharacterised protein [Candidatus Bilamarchaeum dharawalense]|uniref:Uncharacterized protein n=1 Tax=Candidatus Bilamarchaeum dharawalense TaxID=2885759 RepID=A0A5E4LQ38_9ARCH|nr:Uncharacterised protein [Candidatus Bilamarchaeum dharawalense]